MTFRRRDTLRLALLAGGSALVGPGARRLLAQASGPDTPGRRPDVVYLPTPAEVVDVMLDLGDPGPGDVLYDLGSGDGRVVIAAAKRFGVKAVGLEIDPKRVEQSRANVRGSGVGHLVTIRQQDIFEADLSPAAVVTMYLLPTLNVRLMPQLARLRRGARVVSHSFTMKGARPDRSVKVPLARGGARTVYRWTVPWEKE